MTRAGPQATAAMDTLSPPLCWPPCLYLGPWMEAGWRGFFLSPVEASPSSQAPQLYTGGMAGRSLRV